MKDCRLGQANPDNDSSVACEFQRDAPELGGEAFDAIRELGASPCKMPGGGMFRGLAAVLGFRNALRLKHRLAG